MPTTPEPRAPRTDREAELIAAAASDELTASEAEEYALLVGSDPSVAAEVTELRTLLDRVGRLEEWHEPEPSAALADRILAIPATVDPSSASDSVTTDLHEHRRRHHRPGERTPGRRRLLPGLAAAVALLLLGGAAGLAVDEWRQRPPDGPPGTLGAIEPIDFEGEPEGVSIEASLIAHTWGTETVLDMGGWDPGDRFEVVLVSTDGEVEDSGSFLGSPVRIDCRMNGSLLREQVGAIEIRDDQGVVVATSEVPAVST